MAPHATGTPSAHSGAAATQGPPISVLASSRAVIGGRMTEATIIISLATGKIISIFHSVLAPSSLPPGTPYVDYSPHILIPGLVDAHVHLNEPGRTEWEGFWTGTRAAAFGGVTTVIDMPLNAIPPTTTIQGLKEKVAAAQGQCWVDVGFYGGIIPGNEKELKPLVRAGVRGFKGFLIDSGVGPRCHALMLVRSNTCRWTSSRRCRPATFEKYSRSSRTSPRRACSMPR
jgi:allantoinase